MKNKWIIPKVQGDVPLARSNHAATLMDPDLIIIHGGRHGTLRLSDTCILQVCYKLVSMCFLFHLRSFYPELSLISFQGKNILLLLG